MFNNLEELNNLSEKEREIALKILNEYSSTGNSQLYNQLLLDDYKELPVDIMTFVKDYNYLGKAWHTASGKFKLYPYWEEKLQQLFPDPYTTNYNNFIESGARGIGKAQPLDALVFTEHGYDEMRNIHVGDKVYGSDGNLYNVSGVFPQGVKPICKVTFSDNTSTLCCDEHLWTVRDIYLNSTNTYTCKEILNRGLFIDENTYRFKIPISSSIEFNSIETSIIPFLLGYIIGNCNFYSKRLDRDMIKVSLSKIHIDITDELLNKIQQDLIQLDLFKLDYTELTIPDIYLYNSIDSRIELLAGIFAASYYDYEDNINPKIFISSEKLVKDISFVLQSIGGLAKTEIRNEEHVLGSFVLYPLFTNDYYTKLGIKDHKVDKIERFITSIEYVGNEECQCIYIDSEEHLYLTNDLIVTHNSEIAVLLELYLMHRLMCLKNPHEYLDLKPTEKVAFAFMNITITLAEEIGISKFQQTVQMSPWFMERGTITGRDIKIWNPPEFIDIIIGSQSSHLIGRPIYCAFFDEISFIKNQDIEKQKKIATDMMDTAIGGMKTRFIHKGKNPTLMILASSKRTEKSFLEEHMKKKLLEEDETALIIDEPVWNIKPSDTYSGRKFYVAQGNRFLSSEIIPDGDDLRNWKNKGYRILEVPIEFKTDFRDDIDRALCDFAGISSSELTKYISGARFEAIKSTEYKNPFIKDIIEVGNAPNDTAQYYDFFDMSRLEKKYMDRPLFVHLDMSLTGDKTGIAGVWILGKKHSSNNESSSEELYFKLAFSVSIKAPKGYQVSFAKNREFIYWLKEQGFALKGVTTDTYQNASLAQDLVSKGYPYEILSVDRVDPQSRICKPYAYFKNCIYEQRLIIYEDCDLLTEEVLSLERNENTGKVDHPENGSKDQSDAVCGALYNASQHGDEFAFFYGEDIDSMIKSNSTDSLYDRKQFEVDMQEELKKMFDPSFSNDTGLDFGFGKATTDYSSIYLSNGIIV